MTFSVESNPQHRFEIMGIKDEGEPKKNGKKVSGINGYYGPLANIIGWLLEKIFHNTVSVQISNPDLPHVKETCYFNCESLVHWYRRVAPKDEQFKIDEWSVHDSKFVQQAIADLVKIKAANKGNGHDTTEFINQHIIDPKNRLETNSEKEARLNSGIPRIISRVNDDHIESVKKLFTILYEKKLFTDGERRAWQVDKNINRFINFFKSSKSENVQVVIYDTNELLKIHDELCKQKNLSNTGFDGTICFQREDKHIIGVSLNHLNLSNVDIDENSIRKELHKGIFFSIILALTRLNIP